MVAYVYASLELETCVTVCVTYATVSVASVTVLVTCVTLIVTYVTVCVELRPIRSFCFNFIFVKTDVFIVRVNIRGGDSHGK